MDNYLDIYTIIYLDNILIYLKIICKHKKYVKEVLIRLLKKQLYYKSEKCEFHKKKVAFLGFLVKKDGIKMDPSKIMKVLDWSQPKNLREL